MTSKAIPDCKTVVRHDIEANSQVNMTYVAMNSLATVVAFYGLFENGAAVVIGAMIIARLFGPISGVALGLVDKNDRLLWKAAWTPCKRWRRGLRRCLRAEFDSIRLSANRPDL
jgi:hypothetical protein